MVGDIVGECGCKFIKKILANFKSENKIDVVVANGENSAPTNGITPFIAEYLLNTGVDVITTGNHVFKKKIEISDYLNKSSRVLRPANYPENFTPGKGFSKFMFGNTKFCLINILGVVGLEPLRCPFEVIDEILKETQDCIVKLIDFHAEMTSEKRAFGFYVSGKVTAVVGTHTHVQTSDEEILQGGTAYITDVGMTGVSDSVLGVKKELSIKRMREKIPLRFEHANKGACKMECVIIESEDTSGKAVSIERLRIV
ncbi:MAG: TIGR00282 family metallophosphoesterase [Oscillospiraceae bacterium]|jgi:metallophosphoesterase (TIGR00282 family)|nr:TIGR00282 family metallophosphoesterase [Oscillospiraceae bacterium]